MQNLKKISLFHSPLIMGHYFSRFHTFYLNYALLAIINIEQDFQVTYFRRDPFSKWSISKLPSWRSDSFSTELISKWLNLQSGSFSKWQFPKWLVSEITHFGITHFRSRSFPKWLIREVKIFELTHFAKWNLFINF